MRAARPDSDAGGLSGGRTIIIFVDEENIRAGYGRWAADAISSFVDRLQNNDRVGLYVPRSTINIAPTTEHALVKAALRRVVGHLTEMGAVLLDPRVQAGQMGPAEAFDKHYQYLRQPPKPTEAQERPIVEAIVADVRQRAFTALRSLEALLDAQRAAPGLKTIVLVSEELPVSEIIQERADFNPEFRRIGDAAARAQATLYVLQLDRPVVDVDGVQKAAEPRDRDLRSSGLESIVGVTGGRRLLVSGRVEPALDRVALEISGQYLLGFRPEPSDRDGKTHSIRVTVRRKGVEVRARQWFAYTPDAVGDKRETAAASLVQKTDELGRVSPLSVREPETAGREGNRGGREVDAALARMAAYVDTYAQQMSVVISTEHYSQWLQREDGTPPVSRQLISEFALVRNADDWDGFRNVYSVDGKPVSDLQDRIRRLFLEAPATAVDQSRRLAAESSRFNLGGVQRNFNVPTVGLVFLGKANQRRLRFSSNHDERLAGVVVWRLHFEETRRPTVIRTSDGADMPVNGEVWFDPVDGRVFKTHVQIDTEAVLLTRGQRTDSMGMRVTLDQMPVSQRVKTTASITVTYRLDEALGLLVPAEMVEAYQAPMRSQAADQDVIARIECRATYSNFRRFETSGRIVPSK